uniref:VPS37B subunit of ESCRT-I n=1 Tax=Phocoena sinus TaxID=42100 RepID=A0A8C9BXC4_PHOSS
MAGAGSEARFAGLSLVQLNELLEDEGQLTEMVQKMEETQNVQLNKEMTLASNRSLAEGNLLYQPQLDSLKARLTQKYQELQVLFEAYQIKKTKLDKQSSSASLETLLALLQAEGAKIEEDTENMAEKFLDGELPLDLFIDVYQSKRKLAHMRRVKIEKLQEMVLKGQRLPQGLPPAPLPPRVPEPAPTAPPALPLPGGQRAPLRSASAHPSPTAPGACGTLSHAVRRRPELRTGPPAPSGAVPTAAPARGPPRTAGLLPAAVCVATVPAGAAPETRAPAASAPAGLHPPVSGPRPPREAPSPAPAGRVRARRWRP